MCLSFEYQSFWSGYLVEVDGGSRLIAKLVDVLFFEGSDTL